MVSNKKKYIIPIIFSTIFPIFPVLFIYLNNSGEANFSEITVQLLLFGIIGIAFFMISYYFTKKESVAALISVILSTVILDFTIIETGVIFFWGGLWYWHTVPIIIVIALHVCCLINKKIPKDLAEILVLVGTIVLSGLIVFNGVMAIPQIVNKIFANYELEKLQKEQFEKVILYEETELPNIYILVWDEMASFNQMEEYYDYDNVMLKDFLAENNFTNSYFTFNESIKTSTIMTNFVNLDYIVDDTWSDADKEVRRYNGELFDILTEFGYTIEVLTDLNFYGDRYEISSTSAVSGTISGETISDLLMKRTILYPMYQSISSEYLSEVLAILNHFEDKDNYANNASFKLMHITFPHTPFVVDANGNAISYTDASNWGDLSIYKGQYIYASKLIVEQLTNILDNDPNSLIILMSDHGARGHSLNGTQFEFPVETKTNTLNAFYYNDENLSQYENRSSVNTLRLLLNHVLGTEFEEVEVPLYE